MEECGRIYSFFFVAEEILYSITAVSERGSYAKPLWYWNRRYHLTRTTHYYDFVLGERLSFSIFANANRRLRAVSNARFLSRTYILQSENICRALERTATNAEYRSILYVEDSYVQFGLSEKDAKVGRNLSHAFYIYLVNVKTMKIFSNYVYFSESPNLK